MADQDFNIKVVTTADTSGVRQTSSELDSLKRKSEAFAAATNKQVADAESKWASSPLNPKNAGAAASVAGGGDTTSLTGTAIGVGTIITLLTHAINRWKEFNDEQDRWVEGMIRAEEKARALGESILDIQDKARDAARLGVEPLHDSFIRLQQVIIRLKTEQSLLNLPEQGEEWKKLAKDINIAESQLKGVTSELQRQSAEADKLAEKNAAAAASLLKGAVQSASSQTKAVLQNEDAARRARAAGDDKSADQLQNTADQLKQSMTQAQRDEYDSIQASQRRPIGRKAGVGESQGLVDDIELNKLNADIMAHGGKPITKQEALQLHTDTKLDDILEELRQQTAIWR